MVFRVYVEKRTGFDVQAQQLLHELKEILGISAITSARIINRYDVEGIGEDLFHTAVQTVFSEPPVDNTYDYCQLALPSTYSLLNTCQDSSISERNPLANVYS